MMIRILLAFGCFALSVSAQLTSTKPIPLMQAIPLPHHITSFQLDGRELTAYHDDPQDVRPFWYPVLTSKNASLTRMGHPHDPHGHSHHNSVWIAHQDLNGINFWSDRAQPQGRIVRSEITREGYEDTDEHASMRVINHWIAEADGSVQLIETRRAEIRPINGDKSWWFLIDLEYTAPEGKPATFAASGFGLVSVRMAKSLGVHDGGGRILNSEGQVNEQAVFRQPARWCDYSGRLTREADGFAGITLMNHPQNPHNPTAFHVRDDGWMGCCLSLDEPVKVTSDQKLRLRYGLWVHEGVPSQAEIEANWQTFIKLPTTTLSGKK